MTICFKVYHDQLTIQRPMIIIRHRSVTGNPIISMSTVSRFQVLNHDESDHYASSMAFIIVMKGV